MDLHALTVTAFTRGSAVPEVHSFAGFERNQLFVDQLIHFLECVKTRRRPIVDLKDGLQSLRMALAAKASMATSRTGGIGIDRLKVNRSLAMTEQKVNRVRELFDLSGRVAIVTGGAGLLGYHHGAILAAAGAHVVLLDLAVANPSEKRAQLTRNHGVECLWIGCRYHE